MSCDAFEESTGSDVKHLICTHTGSEVNDVKSKQILLNSTIVFTRDVFSKENKQFLLERKRSRKRRGEKKH